MSTARKSRLRRRLEQNLVRMLSALTSLLARWLPLSILRRFGSLVGWLIYHLVPSRQRLADRNLAAVFGEQLAPAQRRAIRRRVTVGLCKTMLELLKMPHLSDEELRELVTLEGEQYIQQALDAGRGAILLSAHFGSWELFGARLAVAGFPISVVARDANDPLTASLINHARHSKGVTVLGREDIWAMLKALRANQCVAILLDQHAARGGIWVDFLGRPACTAQGPARLAQRTGCAVLPGFSFRLDDDRIVCHVLPPLQLVSTGDDDYDVHANTQLFANVIAEQIRRHPEQWLWLHNRWRQPPEGWRPHQQPLQPGAEEEK